MINNQAQVERWQFDCCCIDSVFKDVRYGFTSEGNWIEGNLKIKFMTGREIGPFRLRILFDNSYYAGKAPPSVYLISHRNQWVNQGNAHIEKSWKLCLSIPFESLIDFSEYSSINKFLEKLSNFMVDEWLYQQEVKKVGLAEAKWSGRERAHNFDGILEAIASKVNSMTDDCPCGSKKQFVSCHGLFFDHIYKEKLNATT